MAGIKYGSTVRVTIRPLWDETILYEGAVVLSSSTNSRKQLASIISAINSWYEGALRRSASPYANLKDEDILELARERGLIQKTNRMLPELYFADSQSGRTNGHYIRQYSTGEVDCTCPGFVNNQKCWASTEVKTGRGRDFKWAAAQETFYEYRRRDYPALVA